MTNGAKTTLDLSAFFQKGTTRVPGNEPNSAEACKNLEESPLRLKGVCLGSQVKPSEWNHTNQFVYRLARPEHVWLVRESLTYLRPFIYPCLSTGRIWLKVFVMVEFWEGAGRCQMLVMDSLGNIWGPKSRWCKWLHLYRRERQYIGWSITYVNGEASNLSFKYE